MNSVKLQLESILTKYNTIPKVGDANKTAIMQEQALFKRILDEVEWQQLDDNVKQEKRKAIISLMNKWSHQDGGSTDQDGASTDDDYEVSVIALYDYIEEALKTLSDDTPSAIRLKGTLLVEKFFINEYQGFSKMKHFNPVAWNVIIEQCKEVAGVGLDVAVLDSLFKQMYFKWPNRLYKDESYTEISR